LNINLNINNENQDCTIGTVRGGTISRKGRVNEGDKGDSIGLMNFIYLYEIELKILLQVL
jgi:hypothetical protein